MTYWLIVIVRKRIEVMGRSITAKNGYEHVISYRDNTRHLQYFANGQSCHSYKCKGFTNKDCDVKPVKNF
jgi:hypothetical protein